MSHIELSSGYFDRLQTRLCRNPSYKRGLTEIDSGRVRPATTSFGKMVEVYTPKGSLLVNTSQTPGLSEIRMVINDERGKRFISIYKTSGPNGKTIMDVFKAPEEDKP